MHEYEKLVVWRKALDFTVRVYRLTAGFPGEERFGLVRQLRQCCASLVSNIAEGSGRAGDGEFARFLIIALGSAYEAECQLTLACELGFLDTALARRYHADIQEIKRMLVGLRRSVSPTAAKPSAPAHPAKQPPRRPR